MNTIISQNAFGWFAETIVQVTDSMRVRVTTMKRSNGQILTAANEERKQGAGMYFYAPFSMWAVRMKISEGRATKQAIAKQHSAALLELDDIIRQATLPEAA